MIILSSSRKIFLELLDIPWRRDGQLLSEVQYVLKVYLAEFGRLWAPFLLKMYCTYNVFRLCIAPRDSSKSPVTTSKALHCWLTNSLKQQQSYFLPDWYVRGVFHTVWCFRSPFAAGEQAPQLKHASVDTWLCALTPQHTGENCLNLGFPHCQLILIYHQLKAFT